MARWLSGNWLALLALVVAIVALIPAFVAVQQGRRTRQIASEMHDVTWALVWIRPGLVKVVNQSTRCSALQVYVRVSRDGVESQDRFDDELRPGEGLNLGLPAAADTRAEEEAALKRITPTVPPLLPQELESFNSQAFAAEEIRKHMRDHEVWWRVDWSTPLGTPKSQQGTTRGDITL